MEGPMARVLIAGCGYVGSELGEQLARDSHKVWGLRRNPRTLPKGIQPIEADLAGPNGCKEIPPNLDWIFYLISPSGSEDAMYRRAYVENLQALLVALDDKRQKPKRLVFASSTAVYQQSDGDWLDESSPTIPEHFSGQRLLEAEQLALSSRVPAVVVRFGGIYGPRRTRLVDRVRAGRAVYRSDPPQFTNRIHRDDCAGVLRHVVELDEPEPVYLGVDCEPADQRTVLDWLAGAIGSPEPRPAEAGEPTSARGNKRCRNDRLIESGYKFRYPTFREGYRAVLEGIG
jgi:nucleoside-diphosphate-sugar epimerase